MDIDKKNKIFQKFSILFSFVVFVLYLLPGHAFSATRWDFNGFTAEGCTMRNATLDSVAGGYLFVDPGPSDPGIVSPSLSLSASSYGLINFYMASNCPDINGRIYFKTSSSSSYNSDKSVSFNVVSKGPWYNYSVDMTGNSYWSGTITGIRIDPANNGDSSGNDDIVGFDWIEVVQKVITPTLTTSKSNMAVGESVTLTCNLTSKGSGRTVVFFVKNRSTTVSSTTRTTNSSGIATWSPIAQSSWEPSVSTQCRDESTMATSSWKNITVYPQINPILSSDKSSATVGENIIFTCNLTTAGAGHTVSFLADTGAGGTIIGLGTAQADSDGQATLTVPAGSNWVPSTSVKARDDDTILLAVVAQNVTNLDTCQVEVIYDNQL